MLPAVVIGLSTVTVPVVEPLTPVVLMTTFAPLAVEVTVSELVTAPVFVVKVTPVAPATEIAPDVLIKPVPVVIVKFPASDIDPFVLTVPPNEEPETPLTPAEAVLSTMLLAEVIDTTLVVILLPAELTVKLPPVYEPLVGTYELVKLITLAGVPAFKVCPLPRITPPAAAPVPFRDVITKLPL